MTLIWLAFLTGLTTGGISCLAVQGGLLATAMSKPSETPDPAGKPANRWLQVGMFVVFKLVAYTLLGFLLGLIGSTLTLTPKVLGWVQIGAGLFMIATALRMIDAHPIFRYFVIRPPRWAFRIMKNTSRSQSLFAPALLGFLTILLPCGVTQATMAVAVASGNPVSGAAILFAFILGTSPVFFVLGATVVELLQKKVFSYAAAAIIAVFAVISINGGLGLTGSPYTLQNYYRAATGEVGTGNSASVIGGVQDVSITVRSNGYTASATTIKRGVPVRLTLVTDNTQGCVRAFTIPEFNISKVLPVTGTETLEFTPQKTGRLAYSCSMGMYTGAFTVED
ncbi:MAG: sulfite exporter TauE/SafE family protein [Candidatus Gottesmanbacteria bacterium]|nr:sulfite exporter TauE/SafE family protein [Candidatus Gottesmanbacteria bacterium]